MTDVKDEGRRSVNCGCDEGISPQLQRWSCQVFTIPKTIAAIAHLPNLAVGGIENISPKRYVYKLSGNQTWQLKILRKRVLGR
jgi:hypothetical protein